MNYVSIEEIITSAKIRLRLTDTTAPDMAIEHYALQGARSISALDSYVMKQKKIDVSDGRADLPHDFHTLIALRMLEQEPHEDNTYYLVVYTLTPSAATIIGQTYTMTITQYNRGTYQNVTRTYSFVSTTGSESASTISSYFKSLIDAEPYFEMQVDASTNMTISAISGYPNPTIVITSTGAGFTSVTNNIQLSGGSNPVPNVRCSRAIYVNVNYLYDNGCECTDESILPFADTFQIVGGKIHFNSYTDVSEVLLTYYAHNVDSNGFPCFPESHLRAIVSYACYQYALSYRVTGIDPSGYMPDQVEMYRQEWMAQKAWARGNAVKIDARHRKAELMSTMNALITGKNPYLK